MKKELQKTLHSVFLFVLLSFATVSYSQIGSLDTTFDPDEGPDFYVNATLPLSNGKIIIGGSFSEYNVVSRKGIAKINADGTLDTSFNPGTGIPVVTGSLSVEINALKELPDGKIIIAGTFESYNDISKRNMARLNADGSLDDSFTLDPRITSKIRSIALQPDGKMIITGSIIIGGTKKGVARINADGTLDETFSSNLTSLITHTPDFYTAILLPDGKILIGGTIGRTPAVFTMVDRLNTNGSKDTSFTSITYTTSAPNISNGAVNSLALQPDGKIIVGGGFSYLAGNVTKRNIMRFNANGTYDASFNTGSGTGLSSIDRVLDIKILPDGKMIIAGNFTTYNGISRKGLARLNANGTLDTSFAVGTGFEFTSVQDMKLLDDGNILVAGNFTSYNGVTRNRIAKISTRTIAVNSLSETGPFCAGATFDINYTPVGTYNAGNIFTAQLSDASGDFSNPTSIGTFSSQIAGTINVTMPQNTIAGNLYKIRIVSSVPFATGDIYSAAISVNVTLPPTGEAIQDFSTDDTLEDFTVVGENIKWYDAPIDGNQLPNSEVIVSGTIYYVSQTVNGCESTRLPITAGENLGKDAFEISNLKYYPNPANDILTLENTENISSVSIHNLLGQQVASINPNATVVKLDVSKLNSGTYIVKITFEEKSKIIKISKQ